MGEAHHQVTRLSDDSSNHIHVHVDNFHIYDDRDSWHAYQSKKTKELGPGGYLILIIEAAFRGQGRYPDALLLYAANCPQEGQLPAQAR